MVVVFFDCVFLGALLDRFVKSDHARSLEALALLLTCMYTGENADRVSGLPSRQENMAELSELVYQSREHILNILERWVHIAVCTRGGEPCLFDGCVVRSFMFLARLYLLKQMFVTLKTKYVGVYYCSTG